MIELFVLGATFVLAAGASGAQLHRRHLAARTLARYATSRRYVFVPAPTKSASPRVEGVRDDARFVVDLYKRREIVRTRVSASVAHARLPKYAFEDGRLTADTPDDEAAVHHRAGDALRSFRARRHVILTCDGSRVALSWAGIEENPLLLDAARDAVTSLLTLPAVGSTPYR